MLADGKAPSGAADPAFDAHIGVLHMWALAVWEGWAPKALLEKLVANAKTRISRARSVWNVVYGPAAAVVATAQRLGWEVSAAARFYDDWGSLVDLQVDSPAFVQQVVRASVIRWRWKRVEATFPCLAVGLPGSGAAWRPVCQALFSRNEQKWGPEHKGALRSAIAGRQWPQQRLHSAGLVSDSHCLLCKGMPGGDKPGTLLHRWCCPALEEFRQEHMPTWLKEYAPGRRQDLSPAVHLVCTRGLFPAPCIPARPSNLFDTFVWVEQPEEIPLGCAVFTDGSLIDGEIGYACQALGWAFAVVDSDGVLVASAKGVPPRWVDTIHVAELRAVRMALLHALFPSGIFTDCMSVMKGLRASHGWAGSSRRRLARVWLIVCEQLEGQKELVHWMPAHISQDAAIQRICSDGLPVCSVRWSGNQLVDLLFQGGCRNGAD